MEHSLLDPDAIGLGLRRVAAEIAERGRSSGSRGGGGAGRVPPGGTTPTRVPELALVGIRRGGEPLAARLAALLGEALGVVPPVGSIDITLYRDDAATALPNPRIGPSKMPFEVEGKRVILVDDVLYTGRTIRAAVDAILDYGRPQRIELAVLVDRGGRELPIQPDYAVCTVEVGATERVEVVEHAGELWAVRVPAATAVPLPGGAS